MQTQPESQLILRALQLLAVTRVDEGGVGQHVASHRQRWQLHHHARGRDQVFREGRGG